MKKVFPFIIFLAILFACKHEDGVLTQQEDIYSTWGFDKFEKTDSLNPILTPSPSLIFKCPISNKDIEWESRNVLNPCAIIKDGKVHLLYRAQDKSGTSRIGLAISEDGVNFTKEVLPIFYPDNDDMKAYEWSYIKNKEPDCENCFDGVEDPRIIETPDGNYVMTYTSYDGKIARLCSASSPDLRNWTKHGLVLGGEKYKDLWSKSGAIITERIDEKIVATKINGKYWMYFGDTDLYMATSDDLIQWKVLENEENEKMISVLHPRSGFFDSRLVEPGLMHLRLKLVFY